MRRGVARNTIQLWITAQMWTVTHFYQTEWCVSSHCRNDIRKYASMLSMLMPPPPSTMKDLNENGKKRATKDYIWAINKPKESEIYCAAKGDSHTACEWVRACVYRTHWAYMLQINCLSKFQYISLFIVRDEEETATIREEKNKISPETSSHTWIWSPPHIHTPHICMWARQTKEST